MMMKSIYSAVVLVATAIAVIAVSCVSDEVDSISDEAGYFRSSASAVGYYGLYGGILTLDSSSEQIHQSASGAELRIIDDSGSVRLEIIFDEPPTSASSNLALEVITADGSFNYSVTAIKSTTEKLWLYDGTTNYGVVVLTF